MNISFSEKVKEQLMSVEVKKKCCLFTEKALCGFDKTKDNTDILTETHERCRCDGCRAVFWRRVFLTFGSVTDPNKAYHMEFSLPIEREADALLTMLHEDGMSYKKSKRKTRYILYIKESTAIEDFLVYIGAPSAAFDVMNSKIMHDFRNSVNRQVNCDTANIEKQLQSVKKYTDAIQYLIDTDKLDSLPAELKNTARLRYENEQLSLNDLCNIIEQPVTKSGLRHRLDKILEFAEKLKNN